MNECTAYLEHSRCIGEHGEWDKHTNFDLNTHAPVMFRVPGLTDGGVQTFTPTESVDIYPTLVDFALGPQEYSKLPTCPDDEDSGSVALCVEGVSLRPLVAAPLSPVKTAAFSMYNRGIPRALPAGAGGGGGWESDSQEAAPPPPGLGSDPTPSRCLTAENGRACAMGYTMLTHLAQHELRYTEVRLTLALALAVNPHPNSNPGRTRAALQAAHTSAPLTSHSRLLRSGCSSRGGPAASSRTGTPPTPWSSTTTRRTPARTGTLQISPTLERARP